MKIAERLKLILGIFIIALFGFITLNSFKSTDPNPSTICQDISLNITIDSNTTDSELEDIKAMLNEHGILASFTNIARNDDGKITGLKIELEDKDGGNAVSEMSSSSPITQISFGKKNGSLYINQGKSSLGNFAFFGDDMVMKFNFDHDSILRHHLGRLDSLNLDELFKFDGNTFSFDGKSLSIDEFMENLENSIQMDEDENGNKRIIIKKGNGNGLFSKGNEGDHRPHQKFRFVDNPETEKLIVIDGKKSDFETLDKLAKNDQLETVDVLQPQTAMSIYGEKAKDGAIIATTKN